MFYTIFAFETEGERSASTERRRTKKYDEHGTELISRLRAKSLYGKGQLCWAFQEGGA